MQKDKNKNHIASDINHKPRRRQQKTTPAKIFPRHDMNKDEWYSREKWQALRGSTPWHQHCGHTVRLLKALDANLSRPSTLVGLCASLNGR